MMKIPLLTPWKLLRWMMPVVVLGVLDADEFECGGARAWLAPADSSEHRKYAPDREVEIQGMVLDITPDFHQRTIRAESKLNFRPIAKPCRELRLDAVDLGIDTVTASESIQGWQATDKNVVITFATPIPLGKDATVTIRYHAEPKQGLYFRTPEMGYKPGDTHLFTQGEAIEARHWFPCFDAPNQKLTSEIVCRVPEGMVAVANGRLVSQSKDSLSGLTAFRWVQDKPHSSYLIALAAGYFRKLEGMHRDVPLTFYTPPSEFNEATNSFRDTADIMTFFEREIGVNYPWAKYAQVCVNDFVAGGMENTSMTILTDGTLFTDASENIHSSQGLVAHEMAHQWFGDFVTCKDWSHLWLNEGFATYYAHLYAGYKDGRDEMLYGLYNDARGVLGAANDTKSIVYREFETPMEQFSYLAYPKGGWVLHMLRSQLGEELYRRCIKTYLERHQYGNVTTDNLSAVIEELSGRSFDQFFDQYVYHAHQPELEVSYSWDETTKLARLNIKQSQALSDKVLLFNVPLPIRFKTGDSAIDRQIIVKEKEEDFYFSLAEAPARVRIDPEFTLLASVKFQPPMSMLIAQLGDTNDVVGRLLGVAALSGRKDHEAADLLKERLNEDPFYGVRVEASKALRLAQSDEALEVLLASTNQPDARVRRQVREDIRGFYRESVLSAARQSLGAEKNPDILSEAITTLGPYSRPDIHDILIRYLQSESYHNVLANASITTMRAQDDPAYIAALLDTLAKHEDAFTTGGFINGLDALAKLARNEEKKDVVREFLLGQLNHRKNAVQRAAITALGSLGDPKAIAALDTFARGPKDSPERQAAETAVAALRAVRKPVDDYQELRNEVLSLEKENREMRKQLDELKKQVEASAHGDAAAKKKKKK